MSRWDRQTQEVGSGPGVPGGDGGDQPQDLRGEYAFPGHDAFQAHQSAGVVRTFESLEQETIDETTRKTHAHTHTRLSELVHLGRHEIVEVTIEMGRFQHRQNPRDRV